MGDAPIKNGSMELPMPEDAATGVYRMVYAVPQEEFYFDVLYNGRESITFTFDIDNGTTYVASEENKLFQEYNKALAKAEKNLVDHLSSPELENLGLETLLGELQKVQQTFEKDSKGLMANTLITANRPYFPSAQESLGDFPMLRKQHYFDHLDITDPLLKSSGFLSDKAVDYVYGSLHTKASGPADTEMEIQQNLADIDSWSRTADAPFRTILFHRLWEVADEMERVNLADYIYGTYLYPMALKSGEGSLIEKIELHNRLRIGAPAPEISWKENGKIRTLSGMERAETYVLAFWSSGCPHCLKEMPLLYAALKDAPKTKVLAIGLEDGETNWKKETVKMPHFYHALALGKWDNKYVTLYDIHSTPTFIVLDGDKNILAKPENLESLLSIVGIK
tara:strand:- start:50369 stop:51550 length:1182 start_codon:yes stop_codon:yes gene_type:complete